MNWLLNIEILAGLPLTAKMEWHHQALSPPGFWELLRQLAANFRLESRANQSFSINSGVNLRRRFVTRLVGIANPSPAPVARRR
jgi:hypothetical protein